MKNLTLIFVAMILSACSQLDYHATAENGSTENLKLTTFGGSQSLESAGGTRYTSNHNKTAGQFFQTVAAVAGTIGQSVNVGHAEHTAQIKDTNAAGVAKNASNNATAEVINGQNTALEAAKIPTPP